MIGLKPIYNKKVFKTFYVLFIKSFMTNARETFQMNIKMSQKYYLIKVKLNHINVNWDQRSNSICFYILLINENIFLWPNIVTRMCPFSILTFRHCMWGNFVTVLKNPLLLLTAIFVLKGILKIWITKMFVIECC